MNVILRPCNLTDLDELRQIAYQTYDDTFRDMNTPANMQTYLDMAFDRDKLKSELSNPQSTFFFLYKDDELAGYVKLNEGEAQTDLNDPQALEIERIYVKKEFQGQGLGKVLMQNAIEIAQNKKMRWVWLGVWEKNANAISFYQRSGFRVIGTHDFYMGEERQTDFIMRKDIA